MKGYVKNPIKGTSALCGLCYFMLVTGVSAQITQSMAGYWPFDETDGLVATDSSGAGRDGSLINFSADGSAWGTGKIGGALTFRGFAFKDYVRVADFAHPSTAMTFSAWVWADSIPRWATVANNFDFQLGYGAFSFATVGGTGAIGVYITSNPTGPITTVSIAQDGDALGLGAWHHVAFVADGPRIKLWRDGILFDSVNYPGNIINPPPTLRLEIGGNSSASPPQSFWDGKIDDAALWTRGLTDVEVASIYSAGLAGLPLIAVPEPRAMPFTASLLGIALLLRYAGKLCHATAQSSCVIGSKE